MASPVGFLNASAANALGPRTKSKAAASVGGLLHVVDVVHVAYWPFGDMRAEPYVRFAPIPAGGRLELCNSALLYERMRGNTRLVRPP